MIRVVSRLTANPWNERRLTMKLRTACLLAAATLALAPAAVMAQEQYGPVRHGMGRGDGSPILEMTKELGLSDAQTAQVKTITAKYMDGALGQAMRTMRDAQANVQRTVHDLNATDDQVRDAAAAVAALTSQIAVQHHQMAIEISQILTPDQRAKLTDMLANMKERRGGPRPGALGGM
jgi:Spy/CpxP family protein refolding chaperone